MILKYKDTIWSRLTLVKNGNKKIIIIIIIICSSYHIIMTVFLFLLQRVGILKQIKIGFRSEFVVFTLNVARLFLFFCPSVFWVCLCICLLICLLISLLETVCTRFKYPVSIISCPNLNKAKPGTKISKKKLSLKMRII